MESRSFARSKLSPDADLAITKENTSLQYFNSHLIIMQIHPNKRNVFLFCFFQKFTVHIKTYLTNIKN